MKKFDHVILSKQDDSLKFLGFCEKGKELEFKFYNDEYNFFTCFSYEFI